MGFMGFMGFMRLHLFEPFLQVLNKQFLATMLTVFMSEAEQMEVYL
jgi:hypothetical protein